MPRRLFTFCLLLWAASLHARQFVMLPLPNQLALPQSEVYRVFEDSEGYMWYATRGAGLCRDNGYQIDVFRSDRIVYASASYFSKSYKAKFGISPNDVRPR